MTKEQLIEKYSGLIKALKDRKRADLIVGNEAITKAELKTYENFIADLTSLETPAGGMRWVKASAHLSDHQEYYCRYRDLKGIAKVYKAANGKYNRDFIHTSWGGMFIQTEYHLLEILDESAPAVDATLPEIVEWEGHVFEVTHPQ